MTGAQAAPPGAFAGTDATSALITTKLRPPRLRSELVERTTLLQRLREGREKTLTLVSAPAGYGKSTLLAQWVNADGEQRPFVWLSLDESDSDPTRLWAHLINGLHEVHATAGERSLAALVAGPGAISNTALPLLVQELADCRELVVILDDWHLVRNPACDATMTLFLEHAPTAIQVVISTRADPGLPVARLRAHGDLSEVREAALRMSTEHAFELFERADVELPRSDVERLNERAEGWLAGLYLALLVVKDRDDPERFVADFSVDSRHVLDFLAEDVLAAVSPETRDFLLRTSVLGRLSAALCDATLDTTSSASMLDRISRQNLFLVSLDDRGKEYRYHHLFAAMLERELRASDPSAVSQLHARASAWLERHGDVELAIEHAIASRDVQRSSDLVTRHAQAYWASGRVDTVSRWLAALSWPEAAADRQLAAVRAQVAGHTGRGRDEIERWLVVAESGPDLGPLANGFTSITSSTAVLRAAYLTRGVAVAAEGMRRSLEREPAGSPWRGPMLAMLGQAEFLLGDSEAARPLLDEVRKLPTAQAQAPATVQAIAYSALILLGDGQAAESEALSRAALALLEERHLSSGIVAANPNLALGSALAEGSDLHGAVAHIERAVELSAPAAPNYWHAHALVRLAPALHRLGDATAARETLETARAELDDLPDQGVLAALYDDARDLIAGRTRREGFLGDELSDAELRVARRLLDGRSLSEIARELYLSQNTVKTHRRSIYRKLGVHTREEFVEQAVKLGIRATALDGESE